MTNVLVIGASRGMGLDTVRTALRIGRVLARSAAAIPIEDAALDKVSGDARDRDTVRNALQHVNVNVNVI